MIIGDSHPLAECDDEALYKAMMSERTELIKARRESEDNLVKTIIQLSSALLVVLAGFAVNTDHTFSSFKYYGFSITFIFLIMSIAAGLFEHLASSKAYLDQQRSVEFFYTKKIREFSEPVANMYVRFFQKSQLTLFTLSLIFVAGIATTSLEKNDGERPKQSSPTKALPPTSEAR